MNLNKISQSKLHKIPQPYLCYSEDKQEIGEIISQFFTETIEYIESTIEIDHYDFSTEAYCLVEELAPSIKEKKSGLSKRLTESTKLKEITLTDKRINFLMFKERVIAGIIELRPRYNQSEYLFFRDLNFLEE